MTGAVLSSWLDRFVLGLAWSNVVVVLVWAFLNSVLDWNPWWMVLATKGHVYAFMPVPVWIGYGLLRLRKNRPFALRLGLVTSPVVILSLLLYGSLWRPRFGSIKTTPSISVLTFNVLNAQPDLDSAVEIIRRLEPEVVCLQEVTERHSIELNEKIGAVYPHRMFGSPHPGGTTALFSRRPSIQSGEIAMRFGRPAVWAEFAIDSGPVTVVAAHLMHYWRGEIEGFGMIPEYFSDRTRMQEAQIMELIGRFGTNAGPVIIGMDGNLVPHSRSWRMLSNSFADSAFATGWHPFSDSPDGTKNDLRPLKLDYLWCRNIRPINTVVATDSGGSDHRPVLGFFEVDAAANTPP